MVLFVLYRNQSFINELFNFFHITHLKKSPDPKPEVCTAGKKRVRGSREDTVVKEMDVMVDETTSAWLKP